MNCYDDLFLPHNHFTFSDNIDYLANDIHIPNSMLIKCWKQSKYDISILIPSTMSKRLKNICWRRLYKNLYNLPEINPSTINWYKDQDITWLYGPNYTDNGGILAEQHTRQPETAVSGEYNEDDISDSDDDASSIFSQQSSLTEESLSSPSNECLNVCKKVKFNFIINSREIINGISIDYDFLDDSIINYTD